MHRRRGGPGSAFMFHVEPAHRPGSALVVAGPSGRRVGRTWPAWLNPGLRAVVAVRVVNGPGLRCSGGVRRSRMRHASVDGHVRTVPVSGAGLDRSDVWSADLVAPTARARHGTARVARSRCRPCGPTAPVPGRRARRPAVRTASSCSRAARRCRSPRLRHGHAAAASRDIRPYRSVVVPGCGGRRARTAVRGSGRPGSVGCQLAGPAPRCLWRTIRRESDPAVRRWARSPRPGPRFT